MAFKDEIEGLVKRAKYGEEIIFNLPVAPKKYTKHMIAERFFQLEHFFKRLGCKIEKINLTDYKIIIEDE